MAIKALDLNKTFPYICKDDDPDDPTKWIIGTLSSRDKGSIRDSATSFTFSEEDLERARERKEGKEAEGEAGGTTTRLEKSKMNFEAVRRGLKGWENFLDGNGTPIPFKTVLRDVGGGVKRSVIPNEIMDTMPLSVIDELAEAIMDGLSSDEEADAGNSQERSSGGSSTRTASVKAAE